jgi:hypothetical protein
MFIFFGNCTRVAGGRGVRPVLFLLSPPAPPATPPCLQVHVMSRVDVANAVLRIAALEAGMGLIYVLPDELVRPHLTIDLQLAQVS